MNNLEPSSLVFERIVRALLSQERPIQADAQSLDLPSECMDAAFSDGAPENRCVDYAHKPHSRIRLKGSFLDIGYIAQPYAGVVGRTQCIKHGAVADGRCSHAILAEDMGISHNIRFEHCWLRRRGYKVSRPRRSDNCGRA